MVDIRGSLVGSGLMLVGRFDPRRETPMPQKENDSSVTGLESLTGREREVVQRAVSGNSNKAIAYDLGIADATVRVLLWRAYGKLGVRSRRDLVAKAFLLMQAEPANLEEVEARASGDIGGS